MGLTVNKEQGATRAVADPGFPVGGWRRPIGGWHRPIGGGTNLPCDHFSAKMYAKMKEMDPVGGACTGSAPPLDPPMKGLILLYQ